MSFDFDSVKFYELLLYVVQQCEDDPQFDATKLCAIMCCADFYAYASLGKPITGATYYALKDGPAPRELASAEEELLAEGAATRRMVRRLVGYAQEPLVALRPARLEHFPPAEIALIDQVIGHFRSGAASDLAAWQMAPLGAEIPYQAIFLSAEPLTKADIESGRAFAAAHGFLRVPR